MTTMKKTIGLLVMTLMFASCGNSIENDAKKAGELACKAQKLASEGGISAMSEEGIELMKEIDELKKDIDAKYTSDEDKKKFEEEVAKAMTNCNN